MPETRPAAVLWDMDGTLVDTEPYWMAAERELVAEFGGEWSDDHAHAVVGFDLLDSARYIAAHSPVDLPPAQIVERLLDGVIARLATGVPWRPGARELLADLRAAEVPCALVTMSWRRLVEPLLAHLPADTFTTVVTGDEVTHGKPHPEPYQRAAAALGVEPAACLAIEDSPTGVASAVAAGCRVLGVPNAVQIPDHPGMMRHATLVGLTAADLARMMPSRVAPLGAIRRRPLLTALGVLALIVVAVGLWRDPTPEPVAALPPIALDAWAPYWTLGTSVPELPERIVAMREISPFWYRATGADSIDIDPNVNSRRAAEFMEIARRAPARTVATVIDAMPAGGMAAVLADPVRRARHVTALVEFAQREQVDGLDIDYEQFAFADGQGTWASTRPNWVAFITELAAALHTEGLTLAVSVPPIYDTGRTPASGYWVYDHGAIAEVVDRVRVMVYDFSTARPGPIAPFDFVTRSLEGTLAAVADPSKVVLGIPAYGYNWPVSVSGECPGSVQGRTTVTARSVHDLLARRGGEPVYQPLTGEWSFTYDLEYTAGDMSCTQTRQVIYVDGDGLAERIMMARRAGVGGVALWALGYEDDPVWEQILAALSG